MAIFGLRPDVLENQNKNVNLFVPGKTKLTAQDVFLGGPGTGVDDDMIGQATRVYGNTAQDTAKALDFYNKDLASQIKAAQATNAAPRVDANMGMPSIQRQQMEINQAQGAIANSQWGDKFNADQQQRGIENNQWNSKFNADQYNTTADRAIAQQNANVREFAETGDMPSSGTYASSINKYANQFGVPSSLIDAVIVQESGGQNGLTSSAGAQGLMQLMPETAKSLGVTDPYSVDQNIMGGVKYLSQQLQKYGSNELALAAYNAGPGAVDDAIRKAGSMDWSAVSRYLPSETQNYVPSIMGSIKKKIPKAPTEGEKGRIATADAIEAIQRDAPNMTRSEFNTAISKMKSTWTRDYVDFKIIQDVIDSVQTKDETAAQDVAAAEAANTEEWNKLGWWEKRRRSFGN